MICLETKCTRCKEEGTMCGYCARTKENNLKEELMKSLSESQMKIFKDLFEVIIATAKQIPMFSEI